jgi:hypothetical protein
MHGNLLILGEDGAWRIQTRAVSHIFCGFSPCHRKLQRAKVDVKDAFIAATEGRLYVFDDLRQESGKDRRLGSIPLEPLREYDPHRG